MLRFLLPIILLITAIGLFSLYTNPTYQHTKVLSAKATSYQEALTKAQELRSVRDDLLKKRNEFSSEAVTKLNHMLPDNVDNIRLIIDINNIAARHNLTLTDVSLGDISDGSAPRNSGAVGSTGEPVGSVEVGFIVAASYDGYLAFLEDLEHSLRIVDVTKVSFKAESGSITNYDFRIRTYWLH